MACRIWTFATYAFLHGSWAHVVVNCIWLVAFGPPIARRCGPVRFLAFFVLTSVAGALAHWALSPFDFNPMIGASAADSGLMAAAARFHLPARRAARRSARLQRLARAAGRLWPARRACARSSPIGARCSSSGSGWRPTSYSAPARARSGASDAPVAWVAHIGGFVAGLIAFPLFDRGASRDELYRDGLSRRRRRLSGSEPARARSSSAGGRAARSARGR